MLPSLAAKAALLFLIVGAPAVCGTLRLQGRPVMEFVQAACRAALTGENGPKLVPSETF